MDIPPNKTILAAASKNTLRLIISFLLKDERISF